MRCLKVKHSTKEIAEAEAERLKRALGVDKGIYFHRKCNAWHCGQSVNNYKHRIKNPITEETFYGISS